MPYRCLGGHLTVRREQSRAAALQLEPKQPLPDEPEARPGTLDQHQMRELIPVLDFHVVFTVPGRLQPLFGVTAARATPCSSAWPGRRSARSVVGGWERRPGDRCPAHVIPTLVSRPHIHCSVPEAESTRAVSTGSQPSRLPRPSACASRVFRGKLLQAFERSSSRALATPSCPGGFAAVGRVQQDHRWSVRSRCSATSAVHPSHRISNERIVSISESHVELPLAGSSPWKQGPPPSASPARSSLGASY